MFEAVVGFVVSLLVVAGILVMVGLYATMIQAGVSVYTAIVMFGLFVSGAMTLVLVRHRLNQAQSDSLHLIGLDKAGAHAGAQRGGGPRVELL